MAVDENVAEPGDLGAFLLAYPDGFVFPCPEVRTAAGEAGDFAGDVAFDEANEPG